MESFKTTIEENLTSASNGALMRLTPLCLFTSNLTDPSELYAAIKLQSMLTHQHEEVLASCYLYAFALQKLINGEDAAKVYPLTKKEAASSPDLKKS
jgi:ADP-ribosylglycohydrolase